MKRNNTRGQSGQMLILFALTLTVLIAIVVLVMDVGTIIVERRRMQNAADAAALAGALQLPDKPNAVSGVAEDYAADNGYGQGGGTTIVVHSPYNGDDSKVEVIIKAHTPALFSRLFGKSAFQQTVRAVATRGSVTTPSYAMIALSDHACDAFYKGGNGDLVISGSGAVAVNSDCATAVRIGGAGALEASAIYYYSAGGWVGNSNVTPEPEPMGTRVEDPFLLLKEPSFTSPGISPDSGGTAASPAVKSISSGNATLRPGVYYGGLNISSGGTIKLQAGIYIMAGGGFSLSGTGKVTGDGIMIYNTYDPINNAGAGACGSFHFSGGADVILTPMTNSIYNEILIWQDEACTNEFFHAGNGQVTTGIFYLPTAMFTQTGNSDLGAKQIIASTFSITGSTSLQINTAGAITGLYGAVRLIE